MHALDDRIKRTVTVLVNADLLPWSALLEVRLVRLRVDIEPS